MTAQTLFESPVCVMVRPGICAEIRSAQEAFDFMLSCPDHDSPIYESALEACFVAMIDPGCTADAQMGLAAFAKSHGLLESSVH